MEEPGKRLLLPSEVFASVRTTPVIPPRPGPGRYGRAGLRPAIGLPPTLGPERHLDAVYLLDAGVGFGFAHADRLDLLATHYGDQLTYTLGVFNEWDNRADSDFWTGRPGETAEKRQEREQHNRLRDAGRRLVDTAVEVLGEPVELDAHQADPIQALHKEMDDLTGKKASHSSQHAGECESIRYGDMLREQGRKVVVLCANDGGAQRLAHAHAIARRNMYAVLIEMAHAEHITDPEVQELYLKMEQVTQVPADQRPNF